MAHQHRTYRDECSFIERLNENAFLIKKGFVPNMKVSQFSKEIDHVPSLPKTKGFFCWYEIYKCVMPTMYFMCFIFVLIFLWKIGVKFLIYHLQSVGMSARHKLEYLKFSLTQLACSRLSVSGDDRQAVA